MNVRPGGFKFKFTRFQKYSMLFGCIVTWLISCSLNHYSFYRVVYAVDKAASREERDVVDDMLETQHLSGEVMSISYNFR